MAKSSAYQIRGKKKYFKTLLENCDYSDQVWKFSTSISVHIGFSIHDLELSVYIGQDGWAICL